jgi:hypothetical protein
MPFKHVGSGLLIILFEANIKTVHEFSVFSLSFLQHDHLFTTLKPLTDFPTKIIHPPRDSLAILSLAHFGAQLLT